MQQLKVTSSELVNLSSEVNGVAVDVEGQFSTLQGRVLGVANEWSGQAATSFQALYDEWNKGAAQIQEALAGISQLLAGAASTYDQAESQIKSSMGR